MLRKNPIYSKQESLHETHSKLKSKSLLVALYIYPSSL